MVIVLKLDPSLLDLSFKFCVYMSIALYILQVGQIIVQMFGGYFDVLAPPLEILPN